MTGETILKVSAEVKALRIVLITLLILYGLVFISAIVFIVDGVSFFRPSF